MLGDPVGSGTLAVRGPVVLPLPLERVSFTVNYKTTKTASGLPPGRAAALWEPFPHIPFFLWVSWPGCHFAPIPTGLSQQQAPLRQGDLHLQEDGGGVSPAHPPARPDPACPPSAPTQQGSWVVPVIRRRAQPLGTTAPHFQFPPPRVTLSPPQLLQGDQTDGAGQRPGHEHTPSRDFPGKGGTGDTGGDPTPWGLALCPTLKAPRRQGCGAGRRQPWGQVTLCPQDPERRRPGAPGHVGRWGQL